MRVCACASLLIGCTRIGANEQDGIDPDSSENVLIERCIISCGDDRAYRNQSNHLRFISSTLPYVCTQQL
jgi:polygalacturonase